MTENPFFELYVGERLTPRQFVQLFSDALVPHATSLFVPGNVVVKGVQGSGKSMLLSLLKSSVRETYHNQDQLFPIPQKHRNFIGVGVNLAHSSAIDFGYRRISNDASEEAIFFGDFLNHVILIDLFQSIETLSRLSTEFYKEERIVWSEDSQKLFVQEIKARGIFYNFFSNATDIESIASLSRRRLIEYRRYFHGNDRRISEHLGETKTEFGIPISDLIEMMRQIGILSENMNVYVHVDQYEELANIQTAQAHNESFIDFRSVINRAMAKRDPNLSYRIGTRGHAWRNHGNIFGVDAKLEEQRDYKYIDLDELLRRKEDSNTWVFPEFAVDVFKRRLAHHDFDVSKIETSAKNRDQAVLSYIFGSGGDDTTKALKHAGLNRNKAVKLEAVWAEELKKFLLEAVEEDPLSGRLFEAWVRQKNIGNLDKREELLKQFEAMKSKTYWIKERSQLANIQIAGSCQQKIKWFGKDDILYISGGNILTFLSVCQNIWDVFIQFGSNQERRDGPNLQFIPDDIQAVGIDRASAYWFNKISQETGLSGDRFRFAKVFGQKVSRELYDDRKLSYPGHNGISVLDEELNLVPDLKSILEDMTDYGTIISYSHTTKSKDRKSRHKYYLAPIICIYFRMPYRRVKEPKYIRISKLYTWMDEAGISGRRKNFEEDQQIELGI